MSNKHNAREAIVDTASRLFFTQGYHATGLNQIIKDSESPKGSLYYYFPRGKEELALTCISRTSEIVAELLRYHAGKQLSTTAMIQDFILEVARKAEETCFEGLVPFSFWVAVETSCVSDELRAACQSVFKDWQDVIMQHLLEEGVDDKTASDKSSVVVSLYEGALLQALTHKSTQPLLAAAQIIPAILG